MATVDIDPAPMVRAMGTAHAEALGDAALLARRDAPRRSGRSGRYAASIRAVVEREGLDGALESDVPYAGALERGADVGPRRGPHMKGQAVLSDAARQMPALVARRLGEVLR